MLGWVRGVSVLEGWLGGGGWCMGWVATVVVLIVVVWSVVRKIGA